LLTGNVDEAYSKQALQKGATGIIIKPFIKEDLLGKIGSFLQRQGQDTIC
jgi:CheY-like chemotaxis protein